MAAQMTDVAQGDERCLHNKETQVNAQLDYMEDIGRYQLSVKAHCAICGQPFRFQGLELGVNLEGASMSVDGLEGRFAVMPADRIPSPLEGFRKFSVKLGESYE
jgi:hypothetical protein